MNSMTSKKVNKTKTIDSLFSIHSEHFISCFKGDANVTKLIILLHRGRERLNSIMALKRITDRM